MRKLAQRVERLEMVHAAEEESQNKIQIMPMIEKLTVDEWNEWRAHPEAWVRVSFTKDGFLWLKTIRRSELELYTGLANFKIDFDYTETSLCHGSS
ncbi:MAG TPA: hypothetical protein PLG94_11385 [Smithellaceae bacterium]|jgi:hypothetical protein|nr:hypothetical protein [Smithellaceae bacterium]